MDDKWVLLRLSKQLVLLKLFKVDGNSRLRDDFILGLATSNCELIFLDAKTSFFNSGMILGD